jgi:outer membrane protein assembly factor BamB
VCVPNRLPLATPAIDGGRVFIGGGFGSYDFYAFDALSGRLSWQYQTTDDGPTSAVVAEDRVVFNTESCELEVLTTEGQRVWKKWLGDPLLSIPAVGSGRIFMAYPDNQSHMHVLASFDLGRRRTLEAADQRGDHHRPRAGRRPRVSHLPRWHALLLPAGKR